MKKLFFVLPILLIVGLTLPVYAGKNNESNASPLQQHAKQQNQERMQLSASPTGNQVKNRIQTNTQNQGTDSQLQVNTQEQKNLGKEEGEGLQTQNQNATENMSQVAKQVQQLLQIRTSGGIGEKIRQIAREQNKAQQKTQEQLNKLDSRGKLIRLLAGTDYTAVKNLKKQIEQNRKRIRQLEQLQNQLGNKGDTTMVQEAIKSLTELNTSLQERIAAEEQNKSLFGWLFRFFAR